MSGSGGAGAVVRQGHLRKLKTMKKKFFVLRADTPQCGARLEYYESEKKFRSGATPRRMLPLKSCYNVTRRLDLKQKHVIALFTKEEQFCVVAENEQELHAWLTVILRYHTSGSDEASQELLHPIQHVWQVNVQRKGLGASKNIIGLYNLCLTDKTLTLVKIKSHNNIISDLGIPERVEYSLKNIRRCGDSECFFYMEVGRQTTTGAGELWMHSDDSNIAQSMHSTIYHAMRNCAKETENDKSHISMPKGSSLDLTSQMPARRQTYSGTRRVLLSNENKGLCVGSCIKQCICTSSVTYSIDDSAAIAPLNNENQPPNLIIETTEKTEHANRLVTHHRTVSLPTGYPSFQGPLKIVHERTRSAPLTGEEVDRAILEKAVRHSSCKAVNGTDAILNKKNQWARRGSTGARSKLSPAHSKNTSTLRNRCDSMPSRVSAVIEAERHPPRHTDLIEGVDLSRDETDGAEWLRTPRIPEEPDYCEMSPRDLISSSVRSGSGQQSRTSSVCLEDPPPGYLLMHELSPSSASLASAASGSHHRFTEFQLDPATSHIIDEEARPPRAYSVGSRPAPRPADVLRHRAYSVGARSRPSAPAPLLPRASADDLMELDFSASPRSRPAPAPARRADEYVDMSPRAGYVEMRPEPVAPAPTPDGYVEMNYRRRPEATRPIAIATPRAAPPSPPATPDDRRRSTRLGSQTIFPLSLDSPADEASEAEEAPHHPLTTLREISEEGGRRSPSPSRSPPYVELARTEEGLAGAAGAGAGLHYAALDLEPRAPCAAPAPRTYTQIDFARCEKLHAADGN